MLTRLAKQFVARPRHVVLMAIMLMATGCGEDVTSPSDRSVDLHDLEEPSFYLSDDSLYTYTRSESVLVVRFAEGVSEDMARDELAEWDFELVRMIVGGSRSPSLTIAKSASMARHFGGLRASPRVDWATPVLLRDGAEVYPTNQIIVRFEEGVSRPEREATIATVGGKIIPPMPSQPFHLIEIAWSRADSIFAISRRLHEDPLVRYADLNFYIPIILHGGESASPRLTGIRE